MSQKCCLTDLAFGFMPLERTDESFLPHFWAPASLWSRTGGRSSQDLASHMGGGSVYDDDGSVVAWAGVGGSARKGQRRGGALEKGRRSDVAGGEEHDHRVS